MSLNVGVIGCGLIGHKRAEAIGSKNQLIACFDVVSDASTNFANKFGCLACKSLDEFFHQKLDVVFVSTVHESLSQIAVLCLQNGFHTFIEKPGGISVTDLSTIKNAKLSTELKCQVGFNHRFHPSMLKAHELIAAGELGELYFLRARYGHGGRLGYEKEWRANKCLSGGGELIDQGTHLIDLSNMFFPNLELKFAELKTYFWDMDVEDNAFLFLENNVGNCCHIHVSCTEWKNTFSFEIYGARGKLAISGFNNSYGLETLHFYKMLPEMGPPETVAFEYPGRDGSWFIENQTFFAAIETDSPEAVSIDDAINCLRIVEDAYKF